MPPTDIAWRIATTRTGISVIAIMAQKASDLTSVPTRVAAAHRRGIAAVLPREASSGVARLAGELIVTVS